MKKQEQIAILNQKFLLVKFAYDNLEVSKDKYWKKIEGTNRINGIDLAKQNLEIQFYAECFFVLTNSFLDIFIQFLVGKKYIFKYNKESKKKG